MLLRQSTLRHQSCGSRSRLSQALLRGLQGKLFASKGMRFLKAMEARVLILNHDPVFQDRALAVFDGLGLENEIVRTLSEAIIALLAEHFDALVIEGDAAIATKQATHARQHFPSLRILCLCPGTRQNDLTAAAEQQKIELFWQPRTAGGLRRQIERFVRSIETHGAPSAEGVDPCHSLVGNLNQFSAAEILQMSCLSQRSGRFIFKSGRGNSEIYLQHGAVRHAVFGSLEGEAAVAEVFRWRQGRFYFEEGVISQVQTVDRPWAHLLIDNLQKFDETLDLGMSI
jgi:Domain of unknown function (DUF4388)